MATPNPSLLTLANTSTPPLNLQIPSISIKLDSDNYSLWRSIIISALETFELEKFIQDPSSPPEFITVTNAEGISTTKSNSDFATWRKRDRFVLLWLKSTLSEHALSIVVRAKTSYMAWTAIEKTFQAQTRARRMAMKAQLQTLTNASISIMNSWVP